MIQKRRSRAEFQSSASATDPDPNPYQHEHAPSPSVSSQLATGIWHPSYLLKPNLQAEDSCGGIGSPPCFWHIGTPPERTARRQSLEATRSRLHPTLSRTMLELALRFVCWETCKYISLRELRAVKWRWEDGKSQGTFSFFPPIAFHRDASQTERKTEECKKRAEKTKVAQKRKNTLSCSPVLPPLPNNIYASAFCPDRVMDSRGDFAWAWK